MRKWIFIILVLIVFTITSKAEADAAPPSQPPGTNPGPGTEITQVRMVSETVIINILETKQAADLGQAKVTANFTMRNLGAQDESMAVRFPMGANNGYGTWINIEDIEVKVNNQSIKTHIIDGAGDDSFFGFAGEIPWIVFDVDFPIDQDVSIAIDYTLKASGELPYIYFEYIFATGAGWKDTIGSATLIVNLPYDINDLNIPPDQFGASVTSHKSEANQLTWNFYNFEPEPKDNFEIRMVAPLIWKAVLKEEAIVAINPNDGEAWGRLGKLYKQITFSSRGKGFRSGTLTEDQGAQDLFRLSMDAYQKAVDLNPSDALWHAGFADLLGYYVNWVSYEHIDSRAEAHKALSEIKTALELAPKDAKVLEIADSLIYELGEGLVKNGDSYEYPGLTATPNLPTTEIPVAIETPTQEVLSTQSNTTATLIPIIDTPASLATAKPKTQKGLPICGSLILLPLGLVLWIKRQRII